jgi:hypothetical protein
MSLSTNSKEVRLEMQHKKLGGVKLRPSEPLRTDGSLDRRDLLEHMAWAGRGFLWTFEGGVPSSRSLAAGDKTAKSASFPFTQISDSHIGFNTLANPDVQAPYFTVAGAAKQ